MWSNKYLQYNERFRILVFMMSNGCPGHLVVEWFRLRELISDEKTYVDLDNIIKQIDSPSESSKCWYAWNLHVGCDLTIEGKSVERLLVEAKR